MKDNRSAPVTVSAIIERASGEVLIARSSGAGRWALPSGRVGHGESPEAAMRRVAREKVGLRIEIDVGYPPFSGTYEGSSVVFRHFHAGVVDGEPRATEYEEVRWVPKTLLCRFDFDPATRQIVQWYTE